MIRSLILAIFGGLLLLLALRRLRRYQLKERYALVFLLLGLPFLLLAVWPDAISTLADHLNMTYSTVMLLCVSMFLILTVFELLSIVSVQDQKISTLAQSVAILMEKQKQMQSPPAVFSIDAGAVHNEPPNPASEPRGHLEADKLQKANPPEEELAPAPATLSPRKPALAARRPVRQGRP